MKDLRQIYNVFNLDKKNSFTIKAGENARGFTVNLKNIKEFEIHNYIQIEDKIYETDITNITDSTADVTFPVLKEGSYKGELVITENGETLKSATYNITVLESIHKTDIEILKEVDYSKLQKQITNIDSIKEDLENKVSMVNDVKVELQSKIDDVIALNQNNQGNQNINDAQKTILEGFHGDVVIPDNVTRIKSYAFHNNCDITSVVIPDSVKSIGIRAFYNCLYLESIVIGNSVRVLDYNVICDCSKLKSITIGNSVEIIKTYAIDNCWPLDELTIPKSVKLLEREFIGSYNVIKKIRVPSHLKEDMSNQQNLKCEIEYYD